MDDFFAKKDKKKSKTKKFLTQDELREKLEDNSKKAAAEPVKPKFQEENGSGNITENKSNDDEEWKEIQEEKKDYSNLKIGQLSLNDNNHYDDDSELEEDGESGNERSSVVDPWKKVDSTAESGSSQNQSQEASKTTATASKLYISPALRAAQNA
uniref:Protein CDV3 homolog n=1 Tax=Megaselia scalaris TaxID=36166 RepID=T1GZH0_MEGSC